MSTVKADNIQKQSKSSQPKPIPILYKRKEECCGCTACFAICSKEAISMVEDEEGFKYPKVNGMKCVRCYMCLQICPIKVAKAVEG